MSPGRRRLALGLILAIAAALRLAGLRTRPVWYDEAFSLLLARQSMVEIIRGTAADTMPPLHYFLLHWWGQWGSGIGYLRLLNVVLGLALVALLYAWIRREFDDRVSLWAAAVAGVSPFLVYHAQELRMYTLLGLALIGYAFFLSSALGARPDQPTRRSAWLGVVLTGTAAMYTHNLAATSLLAPNVALLLRGDGRRLKKLLLAQMAIAALSAPWLVILPQQVAKIQTAFWTPRPGALEIIQAVISLHTNLPVPEALLPWVLLTSLVTLTLAATELVRGGALRRSDDLLWAYVSVPPALLFLFSYVMRPVFVPRGMILSVLGYYGLLGLAISRARHPLIGRLIAFAFIVPALVVLPAQYSFNSFPRSPFDQAATHLQANVQADDVVLHDNKLSYFPMLIYAPQLPMAFLPDEPGSHNDTLALQTQQALDIFPAQGIQSATRGSRIVWFVVFQRAIDEYKQMGVGEHPQLAWLQARYRVTDELAFGDLLVYRFVRESTGGGQAPAIGSPWRQGHSGPCTPPDSVEHNRSRSGPVSVSIAGAESS